MRCAANLVDACLMHEATELLVLTRQIFGLCDVHGAYNVPELFAKYCRIVNVLMVNRSREEVIGMFDALVWEPTQKNLA